MRMCILTLWLGLACAAAAQEHKISVQKFAVPERHPIARAARIEGDVFLKLKVSPSGIVEGVDVLSGHPMLRQGAVDSIKQWRFHCDDCAFNETYTLDFLMSFKQLEYRPGEPISYCINGLFFEWWHVDHGFPNKVTLYSGPGTICPSMPDYMWQQMQPKQTFWQRLFRRKARMVTVE